MRKLLLLLCFALPVTVITKVQAQYVILPTPCPLEDGHNLVVKRLYKIVDSDDPRIIFTPFTLALKNAEQNKVRANKGILQSEDELVLHDSSRLLLELKEPEYWDNEKLFYTSHKFLDQNFVDSLRHGDTLHNMYIDTLNLYAFAKKKPGGGFSINFPFVFKNCIIGTIIFSNEKETQSRQNNIGSQTSFVFEAPVCFENCSFVSPINFNKVTFNKSFTLIDVNIWDETLSFKDCIFKDSVFIQDNMEEIFYEGVLAEVSNPDKYIINAADFFYQSSSVVFETSQFLAEVFILKQSYYLPFFFTSCTFSRNTHFSLYRSDFSKGISRGPINFHQPSQRNDQSPNLLAKITISNCTFNGTVNLEKMWLESASFEQSTFRDSLILFDALYSKDAFVNPRFLNTQDRNIILVNPENFKFEYLGCTNYSAKQIYLPFINTDSTNNPELFRQAYNDFYMNLQQEVKFLFEKKEEVKNELVARFDNERNRYETKYHWQANNFGLFMLNSSLEMIVNHGYHGEPNVAITAFSIMIFFSLLYLIFFPVQIEQYLKSKDASAEVAAVAIGKRSFFTKLQDTAYSFAKCFWVSFNIFMTPKFTNSFFKIDKRLFWLFALEWVIGLFVIVLFLIYIASKYSFVKALVGL